MTCPTCTFPAGCTCKPPSILVAAIQEMRDAAADMDAAVDRVNRATAQLATALAISKAHNRSET
jgi:hypothetical protein